MLSMNGRELKDIFDYYYISDEESVEITLQNEAGEERTLHIEKDLGEDLGITFENGLLDEYRSCHNKCIFCFIDQMPKGMRDTLYFKDDDTRLSFLQGNYVTLTNISEDDLNRIIEYRLAPINISVHATEPELRCMMLHNRFAGDLLEKMEKLKEADLPMNAQIVLCKGVNDGAHLDRTIGDLFRFHPQLESLSVVPVGLSKYREGLYPLEPFNREDAREVIKIIEGWQKKSFDAFGDHFVHGGDEWYLLAEQELPEEERYDGYIQLENGVGMMRLLINEFREALSEEKKHFFLRKKTVSVATGALAAPFLSMLSEEFMRKFPKINVQVFPIKNNFFGERITVSGLITGQDLMDQLKTKSLGDKLLLPCNMLRASEEVFLDDVTVSEASEALQVPISIVESSGQSLLENLLS